MLRLTNQIAKFYIRYLFQGPRFNCFGLFLAAWLLTLSGIQPTLAEIVARFETADPTGRGWTRTLVIKLTGDIVQGSAEKFINAYERRIKSVYSATDARGAVLVDLDSGGGDLYDSLKIAKFILDNKISTFVSSSSHCLSACALIFLAGSRVYTEMLPERDRILEPKADLEFHAPYWSGANGGSFEEGIRAFNSVQQTLGDALPPELLHLLMQERPHEFLRVKTIAETARWDIQLAGYRRPEPGRERLLNACLNDALFKHPRRLGSIDGLQMEDQKVDDNTFQHDIQGNPVRFQQEALRLVDYKLPIEGDSFVEQLRTSENAPDLLRDIRSPDGSYGSQFAWDFEDEPANNWCTAIGIPNDDETVIFPSKVKDVRHLIEGTSDGVQEHYEIPDWYEYPSGLDISEIAKSPR